VIHPFAKDSNSLGRVAAERHVPGARTPQLREEGLSSLATSMLGKRAPPILARLSAYSGTHWVQFNVRRRDRHLFVVFDRNALIALLEKFAARSAPTIAELRVGLSKRTYETRELLMISRRDDQMHMIRHEHCRVHWGPVLLTAFEEAREKEPFLVRVRKQATTVVASQNHMMGMIRNDDEVPGNARHAGFVGQCSVALRFRGMLRKLPLTLGFSAWSMSP